jgi:hypothetical protein
MQVSCYPLLLYIFVLFFSMLILRRKAMIKTHIFILYFLVWLLPYTLHAALAVPGWYSALGLLGADGFLYTANVFFLCVLCTVLVYRVSFGIFTSKARLKILKINDDRWVDYTIRWSRIIKKHAFMIGILSLVVMLIMRSTYYAIVGASIQQRLESRGWTTVPFILSQGVFFVFLVFLECEGNTWRTWCLFLFQAVIGLSSGSKGGALALVVNTVAWLLIRKKIRFRLRYLVLLVLIAVPNVVIGSYFRNLFLMGRAARPAEAIRFPTITGSTAGVIGRFSAMEMCQVMIANPDAYTEYIPEYWRYSLLSMIPGAIYPEKPITPNLLIGSSIGYPGVASIALGWLGGILVFFGPFGLFLAPVLIGVTLAWFSKQFVHADLRPSLKYPIAFSIGWAWLVIVVEGAYHWCLLRIISLLLIILFVYIYALVLNGRMGIPPGLRLLSKVPRSQRQGVSP